jgi:hypothetical protein
MSAKWVSGVTGQLWCDVRTEAFKIPQWFEPEADKVELFINADSQTVLLRKTVMKL